VGAAVGGLFRQRGRAGRLKASRGVDGRKGRKPWGKVGKKRNDVLKKGTARSDGMIGGFRDHTGWGRVNLKDSVL